jgi:lipopolysaccharide/colanic/teichoic acid biosynthesis glycosyltransferase
MDAATTAFESEAEDRVDLALPPLPQSEDWLTLPRNNSATARATLMLADTISLGLAGTVTMSLYGVWGGSAGLAMGPLLAPVLFVYYQLGLYPGFGLPRPERLRRQWLGGGLYFAALTLISWALVPSYFWNVGHVLLAGAFFLFFAPFMADLSRTGLRHADCWGKPALLAGPARNQEALLSQLQECWWLGLVPVTHRGGGVPPRHVVDTLIIPSASLLTPQFARVPNILCVNEPADLEFAGFTRLAARPDPRQGLNRVLKRTVDLSVGGGALLLAIPLIILFSLLVMIINPGSPFYSQRRAGLNGRAITVWKIRSMYRDADKRLHKMMAEDVTLRREWETVFKIKNDPRILPFIGRFIRKYSIDELPQLVNVLNGDMSLVGPRAYVDFELGIYSPDQLVARQSVMPGLTGLWQVSSRSRGSNADKVRYDMAYVRNWSFWLDLDILYRTVGVVLLAKGSF